MALHAALSWLPTLLIHWLVDWEASLAIWENNVISGWAELLNPLWDYSLLSASVITDHRQKKETNVFPLLYASIFIFTSSVWRELFSIGFENWHSLYYFPCLFSLFAVMQCFKVQERMFCSVLHLLGLALLEFAINTFLSNFCSKYTVWPVFLLVCFKCLYTSRYVFCNNCCIA